MKKKLLLVSLLISIIGSAQYNDGAPWMDNLKKNKSLTSKNGSTNTYTVDELTDAFNSYWKNKDRTVKGSGHKPFMRWQNYWSHFTDAQGNIPSSKQLWDAWKNKQNLSGKAPNPTSNWTSVGPASHNVFTGRLPGTGRINAITVDPNNENTWYAGAPAGGIWKTTNAGVNWTNLFSDFPQIGVSGIAVDPSNSDIIYISTGDDDASDSYSIGVFKSIDGGLSWNETGLNPNHPDLSNSFLTNEITIDPTNSDIIWVGSNNGLYKSEDGGDTWAVKQAGNIKDFKLKPGDSSIIYAVTTSIYYRSTDNGESFTPITSNLPSSSSRLVLGVSAADAEMVYILSANPDNQRAFQGLYKSTDSGINFTKTTSTQNIMESNQAWFDLALEVSSTNANELYVGCLNVWKSSNGGDVFSRVNNWSNNNSAYTHADIHTLKVFNNKLYCGSDGGLYVSENGGTAFTDVTGNMSIGQFYRVSVAEDDASKMIGGLQDNGGNVRNNNTWTNYHGGDGMDNVIDPNNSNLIYGFTQYGGVLSISSNSGESIAQVGPPKNSANQDISGNWITPLAINKGGDVYAGYDGLYKLEGSSWTKISGFIAGGSIDDVEIDPNDSNIIYVVIDNTIYKSTDGGVNFDSHVTLTRIIADLAINVSDSNIIYAVTSRRVGTSQAGQVSSRGVYKIIDNTGTITSENITLNLPTDQAYFSIVHQGLHEDNPIYVGTSLGVFRLDDTLTEWEEYYENLPNVAIGDLDINLNENILTAATYGRGVWQSPIPVKLPQNDLELISLTPNVNFISCESIAPSVTVKNGGVNVISEITFNYGINNTSENFTWNGTLDPTQETTIALPTISSNESGKASLIVEGVITDDVFGNNNEISNTIYLNTSGQGGEINTFENEEDALITYNETDGIVLWEKGIPSGIILNSANSGSQSYGTNLDGQYPNNTKAVLVSECYELSAIANPILKFSMAYDLEENWDVVYVEYSKDGGTVWSTLGNINSQPNWYNSDRTNASSGVADDCQNCPGAQWTGTNATFTEYAYDFNINASSGETNLTIESNVLFRIVFHSDPGVTQEGVLIDDFVVEGEQDDDDDDNDGILDVDDNCPNVANADQLDTDGDGIGDVCDTDDDNDGIDDSNDNCPLIANADQADTDNDSIGDVCDNDSDNDGVTDDLDTCPNTVSNAVVDVNGCEVFSLPISNFRVLSTGESCVSSNNGSIKITAVEELNYTVTLSGASTATNTFTDETMFNNLAFGTYTVCITVEGQSRYENCFTVNIPEPEPLSVSSEISSVSNNVTLNLSGGKTYTININGEIFTTTENSISLPLKRIENKIVVKTDKDCQGAYLETILTNSEVYIYPNPISEGDIQILLGKVANENNTVEVSLFTMNGTRLFRKEYPTQNGKVTFNIDSLAKGVYILNLKNNNTLLTYKIIRK